MDQFQWLRKTILQYQVDLTKKRISEKDQIIAQNMIRNEATKLLLNYMPDHTYLQLYNSEVIAPGGIFEPTVHLVARIKVELAKHSPTFRETYYSPAVSQAVSQAHVQSFTNQNSIRSNQTYQDSSSGSTNYQNETQSQQIAQQNIYQTLDTQLSPLQDQKTQKNSPIDVVSTPEVKQGSPQWQLSTRNSVSFQGSQNPSEFQNQLKQKLITAKNEEQLKQLEVLEKNSQHLNQEIEQKQASIQQLEQQIETQNKQISELKQNVEAQINILQVLNKDALDKENSIANNYQLIKQLKDIQIFLSAKIKLINDIQHLYNQTVNDEVIAMIKEARNPAIDKLQVETPGTQQLPSQLPSSLEHLKHYLASEKENKKSHNGIHDTKSQQNNFTLSQNNQQNVQQKIQEQENTQQEQQQVLLSKQNNKVDDDLEALLSQNVEPANPFSIAQKHQCQTDELNDAGNVSALSERNYPTSKQQTLKAPQQTPLPRQTTKKQYTYQNTISTPKSNTQQNKQAQKTEQKASLYNYNYTRNVSKSTVNQQKVNAYLKQDIEKEQQNKNTPQRSQFNVRNSISQIKAQPKPPINKKQQEPDSDKNSLIEDINNPPQRVMSLQTYQLTRQLTDIKQSSQNAQSRSVSCSKSQSTSVQQSKQQTPAFKNKTNQLSTLYNKQLGEMEKSLKQSQVKEQPDEVKQKKKIDLEAYRKLIQQRAKETQKKEEKLQQIRQHENVTEQLYKKRDQRIEQFNQRQKQKELNGEVYVNRLIYESPTRSNTISKEKQEFDKMKEQKASGLENLKYAKQVGQMLEQDQQHQLMQQSSFIIEKFEKPDLMNYSNINVLENRPDQNEDIQVAKETEDPVTKLDHIFDELDRDIFG